VNAKKYLVTGGTGFIGSALVRRLVLEGHCVRVLDDCSRGVSRRLADLAGSFEMVAGDVRDSNAVRTAVRDVDCVCHLAYINGTEFFYSKPGLVLEVALKGIIHLLDACREFGVSEFVLASSSEVYQTPLKIPTAEDVSLSVPDVLNPRYSYGGGEIISELMLIHYARDFVHRALIFRPHNAYGPDMGTEHVIPQFIQRMNCLLQASSNAKQPIEFPIQGTGRETRAFVYIDDLIDGVTRVIESGQDRAIYHVGYDVETSIADLAQEVARCFGCEIRIVSGTAPVGAPPRRCPDITRMRALGYVPQISLREGLAKTVEWYRENQS
jgi:nucleoside-diphosphate-sugar epimerase